MFTQLATICRPWCSQTDNCRPFRTFIFSSYPWVPSSLLTDNCFVTSQGIFHSDSAMIYLLFYCPSLAAGRRIIRQQSEHQSPWTRVASQARSSQAILWTAELKVHPSCWTRKHSEPHIKLNIVIGRPLMHFDAFLIKSNVWLSQTEGHPGLSRLCLPIHTSKPLPIDFHISRHTIHYTAPKYANLLFISM